MFFCGMPIADVGPVALTINPMRTCAEAGTAARPMAASETRAAMRSDLIGMRTPRWRG